jgi:hypothetical protein
MRPEEIEPTGGLVRGWKGQLNRSKNQMPPAMPPTIAAALTANMNSFATAVFLTTSLPR